MQNKRKRSDLTLQERKRIITRLIDARVGGEGARRLARGALTSAAKIFGTEISTISRIWNRANENRNDPSIETYSASPKRIGKCGRPRLYDRDEMNLEVAALPFHKRKSHTQLAAALGVSETTVFRLIREEQCIRPHSNAIKPSRRLRGKIMIR